MIPLSLSYVPVSAEVCRRLGCRHPVPHKGRVHSAPFGSHACRGGGSPADPSASADWIHRRECSVPPGAQDPSVPGLAPSAASVQKVPAALQQGWRSGPTEEVGGDQALLPGCAGDPGVGTAASPALGGNHPTWVWSICGGHGIQLSVPGPGSGAGGTEPLPAEPPPPPFRCQVNTSVRFMLLISRTHILHQLGPGGSAVTHRSLAGGVTVLGSGP